MRDDAPSVAPGKPDPSDEDKRLKVGDIVPIISEFDYCPRAGILRKATLALVQSISCQYRKGHEKKLYNVLFNDGTKGLDLPHEIFGEPINTANTLNIALMLLHTFNNLTREQIFECFTKLRLLALGKLELVKPEGGKSI